jgi:hypothetical protein
VQWIGFTRLFVLFVVNQDFSYAPDARMKLRSEVAIFAGFVAAIFPIKDLFVSNANKLDPYLQRCAR